VIKQKIVVEEKMVVPLEEKKAVWVLMVFVEPKVLVDFFLTKKEY
jgi:hypothetical protein